MENENNFEAGLTPKPKSKFKNLSKFLAIVLISVLYTSAVIYFTNEITSQNRTIVTKEDVKTEVSEALKQAVIYSGVVYEDPKSGESKQIELKNWNKFVNKHIIDITELLRPKTQTITPEI